MRINEIIVEADEPNMSRRGFLGKLGKGLAAGAAVAAGVKAGDAEASGVSRQMRVLIRDEQFVYSLAFFKIYVSLLRILFMGDKKLAPIAPLLEDYEDEWKTIIKNMEDTIRYFKIPIAVHILDVWEKGENDAKIQISRDLKSICGYSIDADRIERYVHFTVMNEKNNKICVQKISNDFVKKWKKNLDYIDKKIQDSARA